MTTDQSNNQPLQLPDQQLLESCLKEALYHTKKKMLGSDQKSKLKNLFGKLNIND